MQNPNDVTRLKHLDSLAGKIKDYTRNNSGGGAVNVFTGATSLAGGASGLVPAPAANDAEKFLRGDGIWATVSGGSGGSSGQIVLGGTASTVNGAAWIDLDTVNATSRPVIKFRWLDETFQTSSEYSSTSPDSPVVPAPTDPEPATPGSTSTTTDRTTQLLTLAERTNCARAIGYGDLWYEVENGEPVIKMYYLGSKYVFTPARKE